MTGLNRSQPVKTEKDRRPVLRPEKTENSGLLWSSPVFFRSGIEADRSRSRSFLKRQEDRDRTGLSITKEERLTAAMVAAEEAENAEKARK